MIEPLRPSSLGEILDRTAPLYRSRFLVFLGISIIPTAVILVPALGLVGGLAWLGSKSTGASPPAADSAATIVLLVAIGMAVLPIFIGITALASAAMNHAVARAYMNQKTTIRDAYKAIWPRRWRYTGLFLLEALIVGGAPMAVWIGLILLSAGIATVANSSGVGGVFTALVGVFAFLLVIGLIGYAIWMFLRLSLAFPASVVEQIGAVASLKRSSVLTQATKGRIFLLYLLGAALNWLLSLGITIPLTIVMAFFPGANSPQHAELVGLIMVFGAYGAAFAVQAFVKPVYGIALLLFYYDQRIRKEAFDIEWMMEQAGMVVPPVSLPEFVVPMLNPHAGSEINSPETFHPASGDSQ
jgi:hypothetical protein